MSLNIVLWHPFPSQSHRIPLCELSCCIQPVPEELRSNKACDRHRDAPCRPPQGGRRCPAAGTTGSPSPHCQPPSGIASVTESHLPRVAYISGLITEGPNAGYSWAREGGRPEAAPPAWQLNFSLSPMLFLPSPFHGCLISNKYTAH